MAGCLRCGLPVLLLLLLSGPGVSFDTGEIQPALAWVSNPVARHVACPAQANTPSVCRLEGHDDNNAPMSYYIRRLPEAGLLYETSPNYRTYGSDPKHAPDPIGPHQLPFLVTDPLHRIVYVPPFNQWPPEGLWATYSYTVTAEEIISEHGVVVMANNEGVIAGSTFDLADNGGGWSISGNLAPADVSAGGLTHQALMWGGLSHYVYGVDEVQYLDFGTGLDRSKWYFEASPPMFHGTQLSGAYGGTLRFTIRAMYGNFTELNSPLDWVQIECAACDSGRGRRIVRFVDDFLYWDGREKTISLRLAPIEQWQLDPLNAALNFTAATECEIAAILTNVSRLAILGDFTRGGEGVAIDDVAIVMAEPDMQPAYPVVCQKGCFCRHSVGMIRPTRC